ncbi:ribosyldihydronicotinamide dehydrogenase [quinone] isoform X3 [Psammomys obesus]|uniref:ribosyldihydronicotinamide dehydrogenase [quinone] isoform X3 n=1 Tax=Psammomys obesus TaxID=48139 RepID=UPI002452EEF5|nr:ribosyldihydronicotinamide dehydrogenase [quinone] isoform X3 [Psammomys obesus]
MAGKKVLIVYAHQEPMSFNGSLKKVAVEELSKQGCAVTVSDLYTMNFEPRATRNDITGKKVRIVMHLQLCRPDLQIQKCQNQFSWILKEHCALSNPEIFRYGIETYEAYKKTALSSDILEEQRKVQEADLVIFQFPLYWFSVPAILKGWMDRVLCQGFAFDIPGFYDSGFLKGKLALLSLTTGGTAEMYTKAGLSGDFRYFLWPLQHGTLHFCGFKVLAPQISFGLDVSSEEERKVMLASWAQRLKGIWKEEPIHCTPSWYFQE